MPILKASDPLPERPVVILIYGDPGSCKSTLGNTAAKPFVLDFDRGVSRSLYRQDSLLPDNWEEVLSEEQTGLYKKFSTIVIDTAKAALDDFLMPYVCRKDFKLRNNKLKAFAEIGDEFKLFANNRRADGSDIIILAHSKKDEDTKKVIPDITGQSYQLLLRIADQVGYVSFQNNQRHISWDPTDLTIGKNTAGLPSMRIPDKDDPALKDFMAKVIVQVKSSIVKTSEAQQEALRKAENAKEAIAAAKTAEALTLIVPRVQKYPVALRDSVNAVITARANELKLVWDKGQNKFIPVTQPTAPAQQQQQKQNSPNQKDF